LRVSGRISDAARRLVSAVLVALSEYEANPNFILFLDAVLAAWKHSIFGTHL
jgi:hypothetical protein